ncbi:hypothetical protein CDV50_04830 [Haematobacter massiliensis]|uniref:Uncharacterized protein n=1 Tax=Haematobacter massiliensis TaxID=195105 RepID=A0A086YD81_9RHOB|nr:hypothetical protein [Haematobacter massiliensis]KFI32231.1 hypothetical protein CN97_05650 [Haematobacter massiliensis]OWJ72501.1 hypothetical protein CDV50_04830 [Haematobacter massiliensis]OWJ87855.1 hypothetical protein CDV51_04730 [Haematobacter massiliensis]QBJ24291.1 hypothetical protein HmaOT1_08505 [Haematobacter massiliensis]
MNRLTDTAAARVTDADGILALDDRLPPAAPMIMPVQVLERSSSWLGLLRARFAQFGGRRLT